ncbi:MAG: DNA endonuclease SmrA [Pseudomonadota bacterium]
MNERESDDDVSAFLEAMQDVTPVDKGRQQQVKTQRDPSPGMLQKREDAQGLGKDLVDPNFLTLGEVAAVQPLEHLEWRKDGVQHAVFDKLRRGGYDIQANLDLHRKTVKEARRLLFNFLAAAGARDQRSVIVSPGKGELSKTPGRLKSYVNAWLIEHPEVIAFCSAQRQHGGVGAVYVLLRKSDRSRELNREQHGLKSDPDTAR